MSEYGIKKRLPDYTELAYKEAVSRLRYFLSESYAPSSRSSKIGGTSIKNLDESGDEGYDLLSKTKYPLHLYGIPRTYNPVVLPPSKASLLAKRYPFYPRDNIRSYVDNTIPMHNTTDVNPSNPVLSDHSQAAKFASSDPELMGFIQKQEEYIEQLERESSYCRDELNNLLGKVKEVISENETLHEKQKNHLISSVMDHRSGRGSDSEDGDSTGLESDGKYSSLKPKKSSLKPSKRLEGPNIVFESKISELEAQLTQSNIDLKKLQDENSDIRRKLSEGIVDSPCLDSFKRQIDNLQREKSSLESKVSRLQSSLDEHKSCDPDLVSRAKRSADQAYQASHDKGQLEMEIRRLKDELDRQQSRVRELLGEQARRVMEERSAVERRYCSQVEQLTSDLTTHWDSATKLQLELERQRREESDIKRELVQKNSQIEDLKMELKNKVASLQADIAQAHADRSAVEEELASARLMLERHQRQAKHDANRLNSEVQSVRQRLDRADADLVHSRRENLRLIDQLANVEKEMNLRSLRPASPHEKEKEVNKEKELSGMIMNMESKHAQTVSELEAMVCSQNSLMEKLTAECHLLTSKLDDASQRHKQEMASLQNKLEQLSVRVSQGSHNSNSNLPTAQYTPNIDPAGNNKQSPHNQYSHQNSTSSIQPQNGNQHPSEGNNGRQQVPSRPPSTEPSAGYGKPDRNFSRQSSRNSIKASELNSSIGNVETPLEEESVLPTRAPEQFEKKLRESEPNETYPENSPNPNQNLDLDMHGVENSNQLLERPFREQEFFGEPNSETNYEGEQQQAMEYSEENANQYDQQYSNPTEEYTPDAQYTEDPNQQYAADPNEQYNQQYTDQQYTDPNQYADPNQYTDPNQQYTEDYNDPSQQYTEPEQ